MTLRASLIARLDRVAAVKEVAQIGATIGREFSYELIRSVAPLTTMDLEAALSRSIASGLIHCRGMPPEATYVFKHALIQDAAYSSLVRSRKQHLHRMIAQAIQERFPEIATAEPETVAHHCAAGGMFETATDYWVKAGDNCLSRFAYLEATKHLEQAVTLLRRLSETPQTMERELEILLKMVSPLIAIRGPSSRKVETLYLRARALIDKLGDTARRYPVLWGFGSRISIVASMRQLKKLAQACLKPRRPPATTVKFLKHIMLYGRCCPRWAELWRRSTTCSMVVSSIIGRCTRLRHCSTPATIQAYAAAIILQRIFG